jgi:peptidyl-tRNA hydrolase, PTH1 family
VHIVVGLGNPGKRYAFTRHNIGFFVIDFICEKLNIPFSAGKGDYYLGQGEINNTALLFIKPTTYMNNSGLIFKQLQEHFVVDLDKLLIVYDDFHLPFGTLRFRRQGSDGGHNGMKSIIYNLETEMFARLKIGIGEEFDDTVDHVLSNFTKSEQKKMQKILEETFMGITEWLNCGINSAMNNFNRNVL